MDIATDSVVVRRDRKTAVLSVDMLRALALTAVKNAIDPDGSIQFGAQDATANADGSITVTVLTETEVPAEPAPVAPATTATSPIPLGLGLPTA